MSFDPMNLLPLLLAAVVGNTFVMAYVLFTGRGDARRAAAKATTRAAAVATSPVDRLERLMDPEVPAVAEEVDTTTPETPGDGPTALPGIVDEATFRTQMALEDERLRRYQHPTTIAVIELEGLDRLVDRLGPEAADRVVPALADTIRRSARGADVVAQLAPGRFAVLLVETGEIAAIHYVERIRGASDLWLRSGAIAMRLAIGWAGTTGELSLAETEQVALQRMYVARRNEATEDLPAPVAIDIAPGSPTGDLAVPVAEPEPAIAS